MRYLTDKSTYGPGGTRRLSTASARHSLACNDVPWKRAVRVRRSSVHNVRAARVRALLGRRSANCGSKVVYGSRSAMWAATEKRNDRRLNTKPEYARRDGRRTLRLPDCGPYIPGGWGEQGSGFESEEKIVSRFLRSKEIEYFSDNGRAKKKKAFKVCDFYNTQRKKRHFSALYE